MKSATLFIIAFVFTKNNPFNHSPCLQISEIGVYEQFFLIAGFVCVFWISGMLQTFLSIFNKKDKLLLYEEKSAYFNVLLLFIFFGLLAAITVFIFQSPISHYITNSNNFSIPYIKILFFYIIFSCPANLVEHFYFLQKKAIKLFIYGIIIFSIQLLAVIIPIWLTFDIAYGLYGIVFTNFIRFLWACILVKKYSTLQISFSFIKKYLKLSFPLILGFLIGGSALYINGFMILYKFKEEAFAIFKYGKELPLITILIGSYANAIIPLFSDKYNLKETLNTIKNGVSKLIHIIFPISIILILTSKYIYPILFNKDFKESALIFNIYFLMLLGRFVFSRSILLAFHKNKIILFSALIELSINILLSSILINILGIIGVVIAIVVANLSEKLFLIISLQKTQKIKLSDYLNIKLLIIYFSVLLMCFCISLF